VNSRIHRAGSVRPPDAPRFFATAARFRAWLAKNADKTPVLNVGFYKVGSGRPSLTWPESVDEALCYGWIDGVRRRIDDDSYQIRFSPRREGSVWSAINGARAKELIADGRMRRQGLRAFGQGPEPSSGDASLDQEREAAADESPAARQADRERRVRCTLDAIAGRVPRVPGVWPRIGTHAPWATSASTFSSTAYSWTSKCSLLRG
jgi:hypothetical protein